MKFSMLVKEIFNFQDTRMVFIGEISDCHAFIKTCECEIYLGDNLFCKVNIEGEMIAKGNKSCFRLLSSTDKIDTSKIQHCQKEIRLLCKQ